MGVAESDEIGLTPNKSSLMLHAEAGYNALADAGLKTSDVDGLFTAGFSTFATAEYMGIKPTYTDCDLRRRLVLRHSHRPRDRGDQRRLLRRGADHARAGRPQRRAAGAAPDDNLAGDRSSRRPTASSARRSTTRWPPAATCTSTARTARARPSPKSPSRRASGLDEPEGDDARPDVVRRLPQLALDRLALPPARLLSGHRRRRRRRRSPRPSARATCRRSPSGCSARPSTTSTRMISQMPDLTVHPAQDAGRARLRDGRPQAHATST